MTATRIECRQCGAMHELPPVDGGGAVVCPRCGAVEISGGLGASRPAVAGVAMLVPPRLPWHAAAMLPVERMPPPRVIPHHGPPPVVAAPGPANGHAAPCDVAGPTAGAEAVSSITPPPLPWRPEGASLPRLADGRAAPPAVIARIEPDHPAAADAVADVASGSPPAPPAAERCELEAPEQPLAAAVPAAPLPPPATALPPTALPLAPVSALPALPVASAAYGSMLVAAGFDASYAAPVERGPAEPPYRDDLVARQRRRERRRRRQLVKNLVLFVVGSAVIFLTGGLTVWLRSQW